VKKGNTISKNKKSPKTIPRRICNSLLGWSIPAAFLGILSHTFLLTTAAWLLTFEALYFIGTTIRAFSKKNIPMANKIYGPVGFIVCVILFLILIKVSPVNPLIDFLPSLNKPVRYAPGMPF